MNLAESFEEFKELKNIDRPTMIGVIEDVFRNLLAKQYGTADNFDIIVNDAKGDFEIWRNRKVVETVKNSATEISLADAQAIDESYELGEEVCEPIKLSSFGRRAI